MDEFVQRVSTLLHQSFPDCDLEFESAGPSRVGGFLIWEGFSNLEQIDRQRRVWKTLRQHLSPADQAKVASVLTLTHEEMAAAREG